MIFIFLFYFCTDTFSLAFFYQCRQYGWNKSTLCKVKVRFSLNLYLMGSWKPSCQLNWVQPRSHNCSNWKKIMTLNGWSDNRPSKTPVPPLTDIILLDSFVLSNLQPATWVQLPAQEQLHARLHSLGSAEYSHYNPTLKTDCFWTGRRTDCKCEGKKKSFACTHGNWLQTLDKV